MSLSGPWDRFLILYLFRLPINIRVAIVTIVNWHLLMDMKMLLPCTSFDVIGSGDFFDNSTSDNFTDGSSSNDGSSSSDNCCSSSNNNNDDFTSPEVKIGTDLSDGDNNVPTDLSQITVNFNEKIDKKSVDPGSLSVFADNCGMPSVMILIFRMYQLVANLPHLA